MLLTGFNIIHYLLNTTTADNEILFSNNEKALEIEERFDGSRNSIFKVKTTKNEYLIKQPKNFNINRIETINNEADFYNILPKHHILPCAKLRFFDRNNSILVFDNERNYQSLKQEWASTYLINIEGVISSTAKIIAKFHSTISIETKAKKTFRRIVPYLLNGNLYFYINKFEKSPDGQIRALAKQLAKINSVIDEIRKEWLDEDCIIHGDYRFENLIVNYNSNLTEAPPPDLSFVDIKLVDWEMACISDGCWDLVTFFYSFLQKINDNPHIDCIGKHFRDFITEYHRVRFSNNTSTLDAMIKKCVRLCGIKIIENYIIDVENDRTNSNSRVYINLAIDELLLNTNKFISEKMVCNGQS